MRNFSGSSSCVGTTARLPVSRFPIQVVVALHESIGFRLVGIYKNVGLKFGAWRDVGWWQRDLHPAEALPKKPPSR